MSNPSSSYIIRSHRVVEVVKVYLYEVLLKNYNTETKHFFFHVLVCTFINIKRKDGWVPVSYELMRKTWGINKVDWNLLLLDDLIEIKVLRKIELNGTIIQKTYSKSESLSREFRVCSWVLEELNKLQPKTFEEMEGCNFYNLITGSKMNKLVRHKLTNSSGNVLPDIIKKSILSIDSCTLDYKGIEQYLKEYEERIVDKSYENSDYKRFKNDQFSYINILSRQPKRLDSNLLEYYPSYEVQMSGRISEQGGGMQSCTRVMKEIGFSNVPGIKNYDLQSSQVWSLIQFFEMAGLDITWLKNYLVADKQSYADLVGITKDTWKDCTLTLIMGGSLWSKKQIESEKFEDIDISIINYLKAELITEATTLQAYFKFCAAVEPLKTEIDKWHTWLVDHYILNSLTIAKGKEYVSNRTGITFPIWEYREVRKGKKKWKNLNELKRKLAAFYLQGAECAFIHYLTIISLEYSYRVLNIKHDGLITIGEIPQEAVDRAKDLSGLRYAILVEKPFS